MTLAVELLHDLKTLRVELKDTKGKCKSNVAKKSLTKQIDELTKLINKLEREESENAVQNVWI